MELAVHIVKSEPVPDAPNDAGPDGPWTVVDRLFCVDTCAGFAGEFAAVVASANAMVEVSRSRDCGSPPFSDAVA